MTETSVPQVVVRLQPLTMVTPNAAGVYGLSRHRTIKVVSYAEFLRRYADHPRLLSVSFADDGVSHPQPVTAYSNGLDCWYILAGEV